MAMARRLMGMSVCRNGIFSRGRGSARGEVHVAGEVAVGSIFVLAVVVRCGCVCV